MLIKSAYLKDIFCPSRLFKTYARTLNAAIVLKRYLKYDTIAFSGLSGASIAFPLSVAMGIPLVCIRKRTDMTHSNRLVEGQVDVRKYLIVDDFVDTGKTVKNIRQEIEQQCKNAQCVGILLFSSCWRNPKQVQVTKNKYIDCYYAADKQMVHKLIKVTNKGQHK